MSFSVSSIAALWSYLKHFLHSLTTMCENRCLLLMPLSQGAHFVHPATEQGLSKLLKSCMNFSVSSISALWSCLKRFLSHDNLQEKLEVVWCSCPCLRMHLSCTLRYSKVSQVLMLLSQGAHTFQLCTRFMCIMCFTHNSHMCIMCFTHSNSVPRSQ